MSTRTRGRCDLSKRSLKQVLTVGAARRSASAPVGVNPTDGGGDVAIVRDEVEYTDVVEQLGILLTQVVDAVTLIPEDSQQFRAQFADLCLHLVWVTVSASFLAFSLRSAIRYLQTRYPLSILLGSYLERRSGMADLLDRFAGSMLDEEGHVLSFTRDMVTDWVRSTSGVMLSQYNLLYFLPHQFSDDRLTALEFLKRDGNAIRMLSYRLQMDAVCRLVAYATRRSTPNRDPIMEFRDGSLAQHEETWRRHVDILSNNDITQLFFNTLVESPRNSSIVRRELALATQTLERLKVDWEEAQKAPDLSVLLEDEDAVKRSVAVDGRVLTRMLPRFRRNIAFRLEACKTYSDAAILVLHDLVTDMKRDVSWRRQTLLYLRESMFGATLPPSPKEFWKSRQKEDVYLLDSYSRVVAEIVKTYSLQNPSLHLGPLTTSEILVRKRVVDEAERVQKLFMSPEGRIFKELMMMEFSQTEADVSANVQRISGIVTSALPASHEHWVHG